jgi:predicted CoA-binding protein
MAFTNPDDTRLREILQSVKYIAVVGLIEKPQRPSYQVARQLLERGYHVIPVRPAVREVLGLPAFASVAEVAGPVDLVDVFVNAERVAPIIDDCIARDVRYLWLQQGIVNTSEAARAQAAGITVIMDRCLSRECARLGVTAGNPS